MDIMLVAGVGRQNGIKVDGGNQRTGWTNFPGNEYRGKVVTVGPGVHTILHTNEQVNIGAVVYATINNECTFAAPAGLCWNEEAVVTEGPGGTTNQAASTEAAGVSTEGPASSAAHDASTQAAADAPPNVADVSTVP